MPYEFFALFQVACKGYPSVVVKDSKGTVVGFGMLHPHNPMPTFSHTAECTSFVYPTITRRGLGSRMLEYLEQEGKKQGITCILANISSLNEGSIRFHTHHGFTVCGRFKGVGKKKGKVFDTVWMQKMI